MLLLLYNPPISPLTINYLVYNKTLFESKIHDNILSKGYKKKNNDISFDSKKYSRKMFLYVIQVAECIRNDVLAGMGNNESHDILALSYKSICSLNTFEHVRYITAGYKTTWTSGRNLLYR